jgi:hypothetical protein
VLFLLCNSFLRPLELLHLRNEDLVSLHFDILVLFNLLRDLSAQINTFLGIFLNISLGIINTFLNIKCLYFQVVKTHDILTLGRREVAGAT